MRGENVPAVFFIKIKLLFNDVWKVFAFSNAIFILFLFIDFVIPVENKIELVFKEFKMKTSKSSRWKRSGSENYSSHFIVANDNREIIVEDLAEDLYLLKPNQIIYLDRTYFLNKNTVISYSKNGMSYEEDVSFFKSQWVKIVYFLSLLFSVLYLSFPKKNVVHVLFSMFTAICLLLTVMYFYLF